MNVGDWLRSLGLGQYEGAFRESEIETDVLPELTEGDLEKLGLPLGPRKRVLKAIAALNAPGAAMTAPVGTLVPARTAMGERRQLTVMFCDLVGSTALSARLDPEDMGDLIRAFQGAVATAASRFDGHVAKLMGDGTLIYFGYPHAHEDDAERAARAGLGIVEAVAALRRERGVALEVRAGIATGLVVVGELMGEGEARERGVIGDTPNLAARLQALAEPGSVVIAESTRRLLGAAFELEPLGVQTLKGFAAPVPIWAVAREAQNMSRFEAGRSRGMTPFVGREHEVALLADRWRDASEGEGQVALLSGEAGIGKSRILEALWEQIGDEPHVTMRYQCSPHHVNDAFYPITSQIRHAAGIEGGEPTAARLDKLEAMIARSGLDANEIAPFLAALLSIPFEGRYPPIEIAPSEQKERTIAALIALFEGLTKDAPILALLEDAHWIDPTSLDVFGRLVDRLPELRALLVITFRPEFTAPWVGRAHVSLLSLNRLGRRQAVAMVDRLTAGKALPTEVLDQIVAKTDGVPLFVEELTKTVLESALLREENGAYVLASALTPLAIPSTLQDSLMARLDRLAPVKEIAQIGAAIGREFSHRLLEAVSPIQGAALQDALGQLMAAELIHGRGAPPEVSYVFKHALVQDTAYSSLLRSRSQGIHADIARALTERFADQIDAAPAIVAHHYTEASLAEPAVRYWIKAAELALARSTYAEADRHVEAGLALISRLTDGPGRQSLEIALRIARANALTTLKGFAAPEVLAAWNTAQPLVDAGAGTDLQRFTVLSGLCRISYTSGRLESALALARKIIEIADHQDDTTYRLVGYRMLGAVLLLTGKSREALESLQCAERYRNPVRDKLLSFRTVIDPGLVVLFWKSWALLHLGRLDQAARTIEQILSELPSHGHAMTVAQGKLFAAPWPEFLLRDFEASERHCAEVVAYSVENKVEVQRIFAAIIQASARAMHEPTRNNIAALRAAIDAFRQSGQLWVSSFLLHLAETLLMANDAADAEAALREAFAFVEQSGERCWLADLHRVDGQIALQRSEPDRARAEACFLHAIEIARGQEARLLELRAATDLARLWRDTGSPKDPRALLEPILATIEGGETTPDVRNARALLVELG
jgi:class 3 adenylate cyclase/tetratricopeptide (TPR) repeat protein